MLLLQLFLALSLFIVIIVASVVVIVISLVFTVVISESCHFCCCVVANNQDAVIVVGIICFFASIQRAVGATIQAKSTQRRVSMHNFDTIFLGRKRKAVPSVGEIERRPGKVGIPLGSNVE